MKTEHTFFRLTIWGWYILAIIVIAILCISCTDNTRTRIWGDTMTIELPKNMKLVEVTWKGTSNSLWYLMEPMDSNYTPKEKIFIEDSRFGILEGTVIFKESR